MVNHLNALVAQAHTEDLRRTAAAARAGAGGVRVRQAHAPSRKRLTVRRALRDFAA